MIASNSSCQPVLSCADSPLSITGNVVGILTLAYAIIITVLYRLQELRNADQDSRRIFRELEKEFVSQESTINWMKDLLKDKSPSSQLETVVRRSKLEVNTILTESSKLLADYTDPEPRNWRLLLERGRFVTRKAEFQQHLDDMLRVRLNLEALSQDLTNR